MVIGIGIDLVEIKRIKASVERSGERFLRRVYTEAEINYCESKRHKYQHYAARFAAKEAAFKALGTGWAQGIAWRDVEVVKETSGRPRLALHGRALDLARERGATGAEVSLSHSDEYAVAQVILLGVR